MIINMQVSHDGEYLAVITGQNLIKNQQKYNRLFVFKRQKTYKENELDKYLEVKELDIRKIFTDFRKASLSFFFKHPVKGTKIDRLIFCEKDRIFEVNFETEEFYNVVTLLSPLTDQPTIFKQNAD